MGSLSLGINGNVLYGTAGVDRATWGTAANGVHTGAGPSLQTFGSVRSITLNLTDGEADATTRDSRPWKLTGQALTDMEIEIEALWKPGDAAQHAFLQAKLTRKSIPVAILDDLQTVSGASGPWADWTVIDYSREEPEDKEMTLKIKLKPTVSTVPPEWAQVT